jgi:uncharacterized protein (DUF1778 family)
MATIYKEAVMERRTEQFNLRLTPEEKKEIVRRAEERQQKVTDFLRDLLRFGMLPEILRR